MIVAVIDRVIFHLDKDKHTISEGDRGKAMQMSDYTEQVGNYKAVLAKDLDEAYHRLSVQLCERIQKVLRMNPEDFDFSVRYEEVQDWYFWFCPSTLGPMRRVSNPL